MPAVQPELAQVRWNLFHGDCLGVLKTLAADSLDSLVSDPPAAISFMGAHWDSDKGGRDEWVTWMADVMRECLRVLKPGAHGLVWALPRTSHWTATALEDAGFEIRDVITHLFGTGFPKSLDVSKAIDKAAGAERQVTGPKSTFRKPQAPNGWDCTQQAEFETAPATDDAKRWQGYGTALKPSAEMWVLVRKPLGEKTVAANVLKHGTGALNIDGCRVACEGGSPSQRVRQSNYTQKAWDRSAPEVYAAPRAGEAIGRFPAHLVLDQEAAQALDEQGGLGVSRFFYVSKASKSDRGSENNHPTVKSTALMRYLCRLVTPPNGVVLDPFMGSGSTGVAALAEGFRFVGIEQDAEYLKTAERRLVGASDA